MSYVAADPASYNGQVVGDGNCVPFVQAAAGAPQSAQWSEGVKVRGSNLAKGTAIATFVGGVYPNARTGNHAAIYMSQDNQGIVVWDQWVGQPVHERTISFRGTGGSNDGDAFSVIE